MNLVGNGCWKTFNFKSMKNSKSSSVKPSSTTTTTITTEDTTTISNVNKKEPKKGSKNYHKQSSEQSKSPLLKTLKSSSNNKNDSFRESAKGGVGVRVGKGVIQSGKNQIDGSNNISSSKLEPQKQQLPPPQQQPSKSTRNSITMVTNLRRAASVPLMINASRNSNYNRGKELEGKKVFPTSLPQTTTPTTQATTINSITNTNSESMFQFFDSNGNGYISEDELIQMMGSLGESISRDEAKLMINEADLNCDGKIDYTEFRNMLNSLPLVFSSPSTMSLKEAFKIFDKDSDGWVDLEEVKLISTAIGINMNEKSIDLINNQSESESSPSPSGSKSPSSSPATKLKSSDDKSDNGKKKKKRFNLKQLSKIFDSILKKKS